MIVADSRLDRHMIHKQLYKSHQRAESEHKEILQDIAKILFHRPHTTNKPIIQAKSLGDIAGNEVADQLAGRRQTALCVTKGPGQYRV